VQRGEAGLKTRLYVLSALCVIACARQPPYPSVRPVTVPDLSAAAAPVQQKIRGSYVALQQAIANRSVSPADLAAAYGQLGKLLFAADYLDAAAIALDDARVLAPSDREWPYYLAQVARFEHDPAKAVQWLNVALTLRADDVPSLVWLGEMELIQGHTAAARAAFARAQSLDPGSAAANYGLGRVALAARDYADAIDYLQSAAQLAPAASVVHYPLGLAYLGAGDHVKAEAEFTRRGEAAVPAVDPLMAALGSLLDSAPAHERRGATALEQQQWSTAVDELRQAIAIAPNHADSRVNLGTALYMTGDVDGAVDQFEAAARLDPSLAIAHYSLGVIFGARGSDRDAVEQFTDAVNASPMFVAAQLELANALRRAGRPADSLAYYRRVLEARPAESSARFGYAMGLVQMHRYREARDWLSSAVRRFPEERGFAHALARLLAAAPDASVRDGARAVTMANQLLSGTRSAAAGETLAMALAETGRFDQAVTLQQQVLAAALKGGQDDVVRRVRANLERYQRREPCRVPWADDDPVFHPRPAGLIRTP
jgi:tetratricopeptide (TPR) repeat protein